MNTIKDKRFAGYWTERRTNETFEVFVKAIEFFHYWCYVRPPIGTEKKLQACYDPSGDMLRQCRDTIEKSKLELETRAACF